MLRKPLAWAVLAVFAVSCWALYAGLPSSVHPGAAPDERPLPPGFEARYEADQARHRAGPHYLFHGPRITVVSDPSEPETGTRQATAAERRAYAEAREESQDGEPGSGRAGVGGVQRQR